MGERARFVGGSFLEPLPTGYDVLLVSRVLTDWPDEDAVRILRRCAEAVAPDGRVLGSRCWPGRNTRRTTRRSTCSR
ncbi:methyltransferase [Pseudonocardia sp. ICBG601]|uniref:methyltransferase n=1 Tax=Pseudonocardia sp. ICBG601 TaxID=2846759 RepID=UPI0027E2C973|nr:methyltransferase [Pseudonocardia sp. ICBG601]